MDPVRVDVGACRCPGTPHVSDWVELEPEITITIGSAAVNAIANGNEVQADMTGTLGGVFVRTAIRAWSFLDEGLQPVPVVRPIKEETIAKWLPWGRGGFIVAEKAADLYGRELYVPFGLTLSRSSPDTSTETSTSVSSSISPEPRKPSRRSSPNGTAGKPSEVPVP